MKGKTYDLKKLAASGHFDVNVSTRFHYSTQEYFDALTDFANNYDNDLRNYTAAFVVNSDVDREMFIKECYEIHADFVRLGFTALIEGLLVLEDAAMKKDMKEFADGQVSFKAKVKICKEEIINAQERWKMTRPRTQ
ncbi:MAG: hypothetical protein LBI27_03085 [Clostridiales bacterium]|nr:hypothetical protein [Clostridiales bacterium]